MVTITKELKDKLDTEARKYGGYGAGSATDIGNLPHCIHGVAGWLDGHVGLRTPLSQQLEDGGIHVRTNDTVVRSLAPSSLGLWTDWPRVSPEAYWAQMNRMYGPLVIEGGSPVVDLQTSSTVDTLIDSLTPADATKELEPQFQEVCT